MRSFLLKSRMTSLMWLVFSTALPPPHPWRWWMFHQQMCDYVVGWRNCVLLRTEGKSSCNDPLPTLTISENLFPILSACNLSARESRIQGWYFKVCQLSIPLHWLTVLDSGRLGLQMCCWCDEGPNGGWEKLYYLLIWPSKHFLPAAGSKFTGSVFERRQKHNLLGVWNNAKTIIVPVIWDQTVQGDSCHHPSLAG